RYGAGRVIDCGADPASGAIGVGQARLRRAALTLADVDLRPTRAVFGARVRTGIQPRLSHQMPAIRDRDAGGQIDEPIVVGVVEQAGVSRLAAEARFVPAPRRRE